MIRVDRWNILGEYCGEPHVSIVGLHQHLLEDHPQQVKQLLRMVKPHHWRSFCLKINYSRDVPDFRLDMLAFKLTADLP